MHIKLRPVRMKGSKCKVCGHEHWLREPHILPKNAPDETRSKRKVNAEHHAKVLQQSKRALGLDQATTRPAGTPEKPRATAKVRKPARKKAKKKAKKHD